VTCVYYLVEPLPAEYLGVVSSDAKKLGSVQHAQHSTVSLRKMLGWHGGLKFRDVKHRTLTINIMRL